jgi:hypothetical protein
MSGVFHIDADDFEKIRTAYKKNFPQKFLSSQTEIQDCESLSLKPARLKNRSPEKIFVKGFKKQSTFLAAKTDSKSCSHVLDRKDPGPKIHHLG